MPGGMLGGFLLGGDPLGGITPPILADTSVVVTEKITSSFSAYSTLAPPVPVPGPAGLHRYEVIVCDKYGVALGQIVSAVPTQITWELNGVGEADIDFWILDPSSSILPIEAIPGALEIQIWRDGVLIWWGWPISATFDAAQVHLTCNGHLIALAMRNFGPVLKNYLVNPQFELGLYGWTVYEVTADVETSTVLLGKQAVRLIQSGNAEDTFIYQDIEVTAGVGEDLFFDIAAWVWIDPSYALSGPAYDQRGIFIELLTDETVTPGEAQITNSIPTGIWTRLETGISVPAGTTQTMRVRLYAPTGSVIWDACTLAVEESVGSTLAGSDVLFITQQIMKYAQDVTKGKSDLAFYPEPTGVSGGPTGAVIQRFYQFSDHGVILDAINEWPTIGVCDFEVTYDETGHFRTLQLFTPGKGQYKYNYPIEMDIGAITDLEGSVDGTQVGNSQVVLGQGQTGSAAEIGFAAFPSYLGGRVSGIAQIIQGEDTVTAADINFTDDDIGQGIYSQTQSSIPIGTVIIAIISDSVAQMSNPATITANPTIIGVGGVVLDQVQTALPDQPLGTLTGQAAGYLRRQMATQTLPTARVKADGPHGYFGMVETGDVVPTFFDYGWLQHQGLMRIASISLYPPTEEMEIDLNVLNDSVGQGSN